LRTSTVKTTDREHIIIMHAKYITAQVTTASTSSQLSL